MGSSLLINPVCPCTIPWGKRLRIDTPLCASKRWLGYLQPYAYLTQGSCYPQRITKRTHADTHFSERRLSGQHTHTHTAQRFLKKIKKTAETLSHLCVAFFHSTDKVLLSVTRQNRRLVEHIEFLRPVLAGIHQNCVFAALFKFDK